MIRKLWKKNCGRKIMAGILTCALMISCVGVKTTRAANNWMPNITASSAVNNKKEILCIGNSMTFYNDTPFLLRKMTGSNVVVNYLTWSGQSLYKHGEWINKVLKSGGIYSNFKNSLTTQDKAALVKDGNASTFNEERAKKRFNWYASALFKDYTNETNTKKLTPISYDYVVLQDLTDNLKDTTNFNSYINNSSAALSRDYFKATWKGGLCRDIYELRSNGATHGATKYIINATYTSVKNQKLSAAETLQTKIDNQADKVKGALATGFSVPGGSTYTLGSGDVKVAYTGDVVLSYLHNTKGNGITCTASNISTMIHSDYKHPKYAASIMQAATIYRVIFGSLPSYLTLTSVTPAFNLSDCLAADEAKHLPTSSDYTFVKNNNATLYQYVQNYGTTTKAAWK